MVTLADQLDELTRPAELLERLDDEAVRCLACAHRCLIKAGRRGICKVRFNRDGELLAPWGYVAALQMDPIEKIKYGDDVQVLLDTDEIEVMGSHTGDDLALLGGMDQGT